LKDSFPIDTVDEQTATLGQDLSAVADKMIPVKKLSYYFSTPLAEESLHVIVELPSSDLPIIARGTKRKHEESDEMINEKKSLTTTPPNQPVSLPQIPFTPTRGERIAKLVAVFETNLRTTLNTFLRNDVQLPLWQPLLGSDAIRSHIAGLKIPVISPLSQSPLLLLHNLGRPSHDAQLAERVERLFRPGSQQR
jgi:hypothetical protein